MNCVLRAIIPVLAGLLALLSLSGCAGKQPAAIGQPMPDGQAIVEQIEKDLEALGQFKGISRFTQIRDGNRLSGRAAFGVAPSDRMRVDILNPFGQPVISLASNGAHIFLYVRPEEKFRSGAISRTMMNISLGMGIAVDEMGYLLAGSVPVVDHSRVSTEEWRLGENGPRQGYVLALKSFFGRVQERIWLAEDGLKPVKAEVYSLTGDTLYTVFPPEEPKGQMRILGPDNVSIILENQRFWKNSSVDESQFMLTKDMVQPR